MSQHVVGFITKLMMHFPFKHDSQAAEQDWLASMMRNLRGYGGSVLEIAAQKIIDTRTDRRFPLPAECKKVCDDIASREVVEKATLLPNNKRLPEFSDARVKLADDLVMCPMGREAAKDGWILALHDFARDNMRLPAGGEIQKTKAVRKGFDDAYYDVISGNGGFCSPALKVLGDKMIARRQQLADMVLHGVVR